MSSTALAKKEEQLNAARAKFAAYRKKENSVVGNTVRTAVSGGSAFALSYYESRFPDKATMLGMPVSLAVGAAALIAQQMGWAGSESDMVGAFGLGAVAAYAAKKGTEMGSQAAQDAAAA